MFHFLISMKQLIFFIISFIFDNLLIFVLNFNIICKYLKSKKISSCFVYKIVFICLFLFKYDLNLLNCTFLVIILLLFFFLSESKSVTFKIDINYFYINLILLITSHIIDIFQNFFVQYIHYMTLH